MREHRVSLLMCQKIKHHLLLTLDCLFKVSTVIPMLTDPETHPFASWGLQAFLLIPILLKDNIIQ